MSSLGYWYKINGKWIVMKWFVYNTTPTYFTYGIR